MIYSKIKFATPSDALQELYPYIMNTGTMYCGAKSVFNISFEIVRPWEREIKTSWRKWKHSYAELEYEWYKTADRNPAMVENVAKIWSSMKDDSGYVNSNYGYWWRRNNQLEKMIQTIRENLETRRAVLVHYSADEVDDYKKDTPCNLVLNFYVLNNELCMTIYARSIDLIYGFCNDQYCFSRLQYDVAEKLGLFLGQSHYFITNLHVYPKHFNMLGEQKEIF